MAPRPVPKPTTKPKVKRITQIPASHAGRVQPKKASKPKTTTPAAPQSYFPDASVTAQDMARLLTQSRQSVSDTYKASPMPALATYQQPFIDAATREAKLGTDMLAAIGGSAQYSQGLTTGLSDWIQKNVGIAQGQAGAAAGPSAGTPAPYTTAAQTAVPIQSFGSSQTQYLNALAPYVAGSAQQYQQNITKAQNDSLQDYRTAEQTRNSDMTKAVDDTYQSNLKSLTDSRDNVTKNAIAEYIALTSAGMKAKDAAEKVRVDTAKIINDERMADISQQNADSSTTRAGAYATGQSTTGGTKPLTTAQKAQAKKDALTAFGKTLQTKQPLKTYTREVTITYTAPSATAFGSPTKKTTKMTVNVPTQDPNDPEILKQFNVWKQKFGNQFAGASLTNRGTPSGQTVDGATTLVGPGKGTNWQNAVTAYSAYFEPQPGESTASFRKRMAAAVEAFLPRPKAKKK